VPVVVGAVVGFCVGADVGFCVGAGVGAVEAALVHRGRTGEGAWT
jgi:hypothetical protein